jgi:hypothetical protein
MYIITAKRVMSGLVLKERKGERWVIPNGYPDALPASSQFLLTEPPLGIKKQGSPDIT